MKRLLVLSAAVLFIGGFAALTVRAVIERGVNVFSFVSVFIVVLLAVGVIGALLHPPR